MDTLETRQHDSVVTEDDVFDLYDEYCHTPMKRREFLSRAAAMTLIGGGSALAMAQAMLPRYAEAQMISFTDRRIKAQYVTYDSPGGNSGRMRGYMVKPASDGLYPAGGYPGNDDDGKVLQRGLDRGKLQVDMLNSARFLKAHALSNGNLGATGFCWAADR